MNLGLDSLDLDFQESKIYVILLALGPLSLGEISKITEFTLDDSIKSIEGLKNKGYVHEIPGISSRFSALIPWNDLKASTETTLSQIEALANQLDAYIAQKLGIIINKMKEESQKISDGLKEAQDGVNQAEMKAEGDIEERIARFTLEVEQEKDQIKEDVIKIFEAKTKDHEILISGIKQKLSQGVDTTSSSIQGVNQKLLEGYQTGLDELKSKEHQRNLTLKSQAQDLIVQTENSLNQGIQNVNTTMEKTGQSLYESIDERNEKLKSHIIVVTENFAEKITKVSDDSQHQVLSAIGSYNDKIQEQLSKNKQEATTAFGLTNEEIKTKTEISAQNLHKTINEALVNAQNQLTNMLQKSQENLSQTVSEARNQLDMSIKEFSDSVKIQTETDIHKIVENTESTLGVLSQDAQNTSEEAKEKITSILSGMKIEAEQKTNETKTSALMELDNIINSLKTNISSQIEGFKSTLEPQEKYLKEKLTSFRSELSESQEHSIKTFTDFMDEFKTSVIANHRNLNEIIVKEQESIIESINTFITDINNQLTDYDVKFSSALKDSANKTSEKIVAKTTEFQEKMIAVVNEMNNTATNQLSVTNEIISSSIEAEIGTLEAELADYASKYKELTLANEEIFKNHLFSLEKLTSLVKQAKHPKVQTVPIISKEATLTYIESMFSRMKGGITLLLPNISDIPIDSILSTKNHQRINIVSIIDPVTHKDIIKKLFQKPNVRIRSVDQTKFEGVEGYLAADRDGEEVLIGVTEDKGEVVAIASESDAFINLMGKIVLGDYFLARSQEINRIDVGM